MSENTNTEREALMKLADAYADASFDQGLYHRTLDDKPEEAREELEKALSKALEARSSLSLPAAGQEPVADDEWKVRGYLAKTLKCWHRLTDEEAAELVAMTQRLAGLYPAPRPAPPTEQQAYDMGAKGAPATDAERLLFEAWMRGHCWALCATWDGKCYRSDAEQNGNIDPRAMNTRQLWDAWRDRAALAAPQPAVAAGWMPIETAPKDGTLFLGWVFAERYGETDEGQQYAHDESQIDRCWWRTGDHGGYFDNACGQLADRQAITHWMKLPEPPNGKN